MLSKRASQEVYRATHASAPPLPPRRTSIARRLPFSLVLPRRASPSEPHMHSVVRENTAIRATSPSQCRRYLDIYDTLSLPHLRRPSVAYSNATHPFVDSPGSFFHLLLGSERSKTDVPVLGRLSNTCLVATIETSKLQHAAAVNACDVATPLSAALVLSTQSCGGMYPVITSRVVLHLFRQSRLPSNYPGYRDPDLRTTVIRRVHRAAQDTPRRGPTVLLNW